MPGDRSGHPGRGGGGRVVNFPRIRRPSRQSAEVTQSDLSVLRERRGGVVIHLPRSLGLAANEPILQITSPPPDPGNEGGTLSDTSVATADAPPGFRRVFAADSPEHGGSTCALPYRRR
jgi:hypothetical protein